MNTPLIEEINNRHPGYNQALLETVVSMVVRSALYDKQILRLLTDTEDEVLRKERVAKLLDISDSKLDQLIKDGRWFMVKGPGGKYGMTRKQFRAQRDMYFQLKKR